MVLMRLSRTRLCKLAGATLLVLEAIPAPLAAAGDAAQPDNPDKPDSSEPTEHAADTSRLAGSDYRVPIQAVADFLAAR